jgi:hypothetical protein
MFNGSLDLPAVEIIKGDSISYMLIGCLYDLNLDKLYWISGSKPPASTSEAFYFSVDNVSHGYFGRKCLITKKTLVFLI